MLWKGMRGVSPRRWPSNPACRLRAVRARRGREPVQWAMCAGPVGCGVWRRQRSRARSRAPGRRAGVHSAVWWVHAPRHAPRPATPRPNTHEPSSRPEQINRAALLGSAPSRPLRDMDPLSNGSSRSRVSRPARSTAPVQCRQPSGETWHKDRSLEVKRSFPNLWTVGNAPSLSPPHARAPTLFSLSSSPSTLDPRRVAT